MSELSLHETVFEASDRTIREAFDGSSLSKDGAAPSRTCTNREMLVVDLFARLLPVATRTVHGAVLCDSYGAHSGDVDIAVLAPWGAPVWPYLAHPLVPCEGVITGVFVESGALAPKSSVWGEVARARALFKRVGRRPDSLDGVAPAFTPNLGIWCWKDAPKAARLKASLSEAETKLASRDGVTAREALKAHAIRCKPDGRGDDEYSARVIAAGPHTPTWFYWHGERPEGAAFAYRVHAVASSSSKTTDWNAPRMMPGLSPFADEVSEEWQVGPMFWRYNFVRSAKRPGRALRALCAYLSTQVVLYESESPSFGAYAR